MEQKRVVYQLPGMDQVTVRHNLPYKPDGMPGLAMDVYTPFTIQDDEHHPAVMFVHGEVPPEDVPRVRSWGQYVCWGKLVAASGLVGITFSHRSTERFTSFAGAIEDVDDLIAHVRSSADALHVDADRLAIWTCSAGAYLGVGAALRDTPKRIRALVSYYGIMDIAHYLHIEDLVAATNVPNDLLPLHDLDHSSEGVPPMLVVRAGRDRPSLNATIDRFVTASLDRNLDIELCNYPEGRHAFDILDDTDRSRLIIHRTLAFLRDRLT